MTPPDDALFLGLDCSTQSMSAVVTDLHGVVVHECVLSFDKDFPAYGTTNGVLRHKDECDRDVVEIPSLLFVDALDAIFAQLAASGAVDLARVASVSGSAQQHASVYWSSGFSLRERLDTANPETPLVDVLKSGSTPPFYHENGPSWMDNSTTAYCKMLEDAAGGPLALYQISGSRAYERFTANQIAKRCNDTLSFLNKVGRIALVSSMLTSLLCGDYTPIDESDGSGMNLLDIRKREWADELVNAIADQAVPHPPGMTARLRKVLGEEVAKPYHMIGELHPYFQKKFGFSPHCAVVPFSGDNPCTLAGTGLSGPDDVAISLGTSSTLMSVVAPGTQADHNIDGHLFCNPIDPDNLMAMLCFQNGSLTRQHIRDRFANGSWETFNEMLESTPPGNNGNTGFYFTDPEINPRVAKAGEVAYPGSSNRVIGWPFTGAVAVRAVVESQFVMMRVYAERLGIRNPKRLIVVGGAAVNTSLLQVLADVFGAPVVRLGSSSTNSAALGAALRAQHGLACGSASEGKFVPFPSSESFEFTPAASPNASAAKFFSDELGEFMDRMFRAEAALS
ncbi:hypothetical protein PybrP1_006254 [[Pythium] brassicae (nom. inval.)]|nr:hypothetical protein PybrP1_006254 [[Pythium] brassicae (nom. inval.)]